jgi:hypothetical protein
VVTGAIILKGITRFGNIPAAYLAGVRSTPGLPATAVGFSLEGVSDEIGDWIADKIVDAVSSVAGL